jgi:hypothetical protein
MDRQAILQLLENVASGQLAAAEAFKHLENLPFEDLGFARIDHHRTLRKGYPETIFCQGKTTDQIIAIAERLLANASLTLATRIEPDAAQALTARFPVAEYDELARTVVIKPEGMVLPEKGLVAVVSAGTADLPVALEAAVTARTMGARVECFFDVGVAGIHRLLACTEQLRQAHALVVAAGMEGALASVVGGLVDAPVIAVPTSVGYGASFNGLSALLTMLNSCASGISVVNIDNGYGAGYSAAVINNQTVTSE